MRWAATEQFSLTALGGYDSYDYQSLGGNSGGQAWQLGVDWQPSARTRLQASAGKRYYGNSYSLQAQHRARVSVWTASYNDSVTSTRQQFLLPSTVDTVSLLDRLFYRHHPRPRCAASGGGGLYAGHRLADLAGQ